MHNNANIPIEMVESHLQDLVSKGILKKTGRGPATHYVLAEKAGSIQR